MCGPCGGRYRQGATGPPKRDAEGNFLCDSCDAKFPTNSALSGHRRFCDGGKWSCDWCGCKRLETSGRAPGPKGPATLCAACGGRFRGGAKSAPSKCPETGKFKCDGCGSLFDSIGHYPDTGGSAMAVHGAATGVLVRLVKQATGRTPVLRGPATLCGPCGGRFRGGATGPPTRNEAVVSCAIVAAASTRRWAASRPTSGPATGQLALRLVRRVLSEVGGRRNRGRTGPSTLWVPAVRGGARAPRDLRPETTKAGMCATTAVRCHDTIAGLAGHKRVLRERPREFSRPRRRRGRRARS